MLEPSHIVVKPFKSLKTFKVSVKQIWQYIAHPYVQCSRLTPALRFC